MRRSIPLAAVPLAALALCACQPSNDGGTAASEPADAPTVQAPPPPEFSGDIDGRGTEPFWLLKIRADKLTLTRPSHTDLMAANAGPTMQGDAAVWVTEADAPLSVTLRNVPCSDGMSEQTYPLTAVVRAGTETLKGCASKVVALPEPGA